MEFKKRTLKHLGWRYANLTDGKSQSWTLILLTAASVAAHALVLGLPILTTNPTEIPELPPAPKTEAAMDVAILPKQTLDMPQEIARPDEPPQDSQVPQPGSTAPATVGSPPTPPPNLSVPSPSEADNPPANVTVPVIETDTSIPVEEGSESLEDMPVDPGSTKLSQLEPPSPPTLTEQLQDPAAYQYDGRKSLGFIEATQALQDWAPEGQPLPSRTDVMEIPYQLNDQCLTPAPSPGLLVVVAASDGTFLDGPNVLSSTGYSLLDEQAKAIVETGEYPLPDRDQAKAYAVEFRVLYPATCI